ncbi:hyoscyamine 6-dioxygenase-like [Hibiscus syriacus]|uniref:Hyoscyamine 6-dioxygenase-like n=1 Tax=Hibiscus syriacus TaxID=106335 RepID=A0A6A3BYP6_HIBSY|nr:hyoscyamine 6-dioxygenase-like [Hibiscus syriacus]
MEKASRSLISNFNRQRFRGISSLLSRDYISVNSPSSSSSASPLHSIDRRIQSCAKTHVSILKTIQFHTNPFRNICRLAEKPTQLSSRQRKLREKSDLEEAFESANTSEEMLKAFKDMEACFEERDLGLASLKVGLKLDQEGEDPEKALSFAEKALRALDQDGNLPYSLPGFTIDGLEEEKAANVEDIRPVLHAVQLELGNVKTAMGRREEALENLKKALEIKEMTLEKDSTGDHIKELGIFGGDRMGKYDEAVNTLKGIAQKTDKDSENRALKETVSPIEVAEAYSEISMQYESDVPQAIPYLESAAEIMKESFGSKHLVSDIMDVSLGPHHVDSIEACQNLSKAYSAMGSLHLRGAAVIDAWEGHGATAEVELREAQEVLKS